MKPVEKKFRRGMKTIINSIDTLIGTETRSDRSSIPLALRADRFSPIPKSTRNSMTPITNNNPGIMGIGTDWTSTL